MLIIVYSAIIMGSKLSEEVGGAINRAETNTRFARVFARLHKYSILREVLGYTFT